MKKIALFIALNIVFGLAAFSQSKAYFTSGSEMIFSFAKIDYEGDESGNIMRWAPVINLQGMLNKDISKNIGFFTGLAIRNVGYIYDNYKTVNDNGEPITVKKKFRTYNLGLPLGVKIGNLDKFFVYGGYEMEFPFHYKEKTFIDEKKDKFTAWFSNRVEQFQQSFFVGVQLPYGANLKFKYYISNFHNKDYYETSSASKPYENLNGNVFYVSLSFNIFRNGEFNDPSDSSKEYF